jgi:hypothetical protein
MTIWRIAAAFAAGLLFGLGLVISRMIDPAKVQAFLDIAGNWDPSLAFVMLGAVVVAAVGFRLTGQRQHPILERDFRKPAKTQIDRPLVAGAILFGIGWGLVGYCPGPALTSLGLGRSETIVFVAAMLAGMFAYQWLELLSQKYKTAG